MTIKNMQKYLFGKYEKKKYENSSKGRNLRLDDLLSWCFYCIHVSQTQKSHFRSSMEVGFYGNINIINYLVMLDL